MTRMLVVWLDNKIVGRVSEDNDIWSFTYDRDWAKHEGRFNISPHIAFSGNAITDGSTIRPVQWFFDNLLPEEGSREVLSKEINVNVADSFGLLEYYGAESAGALTLLPDGEMFEYSTEEVKLDNDSLSRRIQNLPKLSLNYAAPKKMSLAGAQNKLAVNYHAGNKAIYEPAKRSISTHILKPDHTDHTTYYNSTVNEWFVMRLAKSVGLAVPDVHLVFVPEPVYIVERFDREKNIINNVIGRKHAIDGCQALNLSRANKYSSATVENLSALIYQCRAKALTRAALFNWVLFNILIGNDDAHLKNLSFYIGNEGIELTPFYDMLATSIYQEAPLQSKMACELNGVKVFAGVNKETLYVFAESIGIHRKAAEVYLLKMIGNISPRFDGLYNEFESMQLPDGYGPYKMNALRMLREIKYKVMDEVINNLTGS